MLNDPRFRPSRTRDLRRQAISETGAFLTWALKQGGAMPRVPRRRVDEGGFSTLLRMPGGRAAMSRWWEATLETLAKMGG